MKSESSAAKFQCIVGILVYVIGFIVGLVLGNTLRTPDIDSGAGFNILLMLLTWFSAFIVGSLFIGIGEIISKLYESNEKVNWMCKEIYRQQTQKSINE